jgi:hypothetical protein
VRASWRKVQCTAKIADSFACQHNLVAPTPAPDPSLVCDDGWLPHRTDSAAAGRRLNCYKPFNFETQKALDWYEGNSFCARFGATLPTIDSPALNNFTSTLVNGHITYIGELHMARILAPWL